MKTVNLVLAALVLMSSGVGNAMEFDSPHTQLVVEAVEGRCVSAAAMGMFLSKKIDDHIYQTVTLAGGQVVSRGMIKVKGDFNSYGRFNAKLKYLGAKELPTEDGFTAKFGLWEECK